MNSSTTDIHILQFGTGNFLRGFFEPMIQDLHDQNKNLNICIIQSTGGNSLEKLRAQNFEFHVLEAGVKNGQKIEKIRKITCVKDGLALPDESEKFLDFAENPSVKWIISNVTEAGLVWKMEGPMENFAESFAGRLTQWLYRRNQVLPEVETVILPCELLPGNGEILRDFVLNHAKNWNLESDFLLWLDRKVHFFTNLVDRIVPGFPHDLDLEEKTADSLIVQVEPYSFWAIQGEASKGKLLPFVQSQSEVVIAPDISEFALRKIRILNGCHTWMAVFNLWNPRVETVSEFMNQVENRSLLTRLLEEEIIPSIPLPKEMLEGYAQEIFDRFANPFVAHQLHDIALNSVAKFKSRLLPVIKFHLDRYGKVPPLAGKGLLYLILSYLSKSDQIRDTTETQSYFKSFSPQSHTKTNLQIVVRDQFQLTWDQNWDNLLEEILAEQTRN